jgi:hypothetical protein
MHVGVQAAFTDMRKSEPAAERKGNGKAKWQSEMAKRNGKNGKAKMAKRNAEQSAARTFPSLSHGPGGLRQSLREVREFGCWCLRRFPLNK